MRYICKTCHKAGRVVEVVSDDGRPSEYETHAAHKGFGLGVGNHTAKDMVDETDTLEGFLRVYATSDRIALDIDVDKWQDDKPSPFIILRSKGRVFILNPMAFPDHLCVDAHTFINGDDARTGVFGMEEGRRITFPENEAYGYSHKWPAMRLISLLLGKQS